MTAEEYLARERLAEVKSEFIDGQVYAMSGASRAHNLVAANCAREIGNRIADVPCELYIADMRVKISRQGNYVYPDLTIVCGEPRFEDDIFDTLINPTVVVEILSPSTASWDRAGKFVNYRSVESLREYILIAQDEVRVERFERHGADWTLREWTDLEASLRVESIACEIPLREIYLKVSFKNS
jgi:Uma2 family endonuclease